MPNQPKRKKRNRRSKNKTPPPNAPAFARPNIPDYRPVTPEEEELIRQFQADRPDYSREAILRILDAALASDSATEDSQLVAELPGPIE